MPEPTLAPALSPARADRLTGCPADSELRPIPDWPGYFASEAGCIYSCRTNGGKLGPVLREKKPAPTRDGYLNVKLHRLGKTLYTGVHHLVCMAFLGPPPPGCQACHGNDVRTDNRISNLRWDTPAGNIGDRDARGRTAKGSRHGNAKLTEDLIIEFRELRNAGLSGAAIAARLGVYRSTVNRALRGSSWKHATDEGASGASSLS